MVLFKLLRRAIVRVADAVDFAALDFFDGAEGLRRQLAAVDPLAYLCGRYAHTMRDLIQSEPFVVREFLRGARFVGLDAIAGDEFVLLRGVLFCWCHIAPE